MSIKLEEAKEVELIKKIKGRSKYRDTIEEFLNSDLKMAKITCEYRARASSIAHLLKDWLKEGDDILIFREGRIVYLKKR